MTLWDPLLRMKVDSVWLAKITRDLPDRKCFRELVLCLFTYFFQRLLMSLLIMYFQKRSVSTKREMVSVWQFFSLFSSCCLCWQMQFWLTCVSILMCQSISCVCTVYQFLNTIYLCFTDYTNDTNQLMGCEPVTNNSNLGL